MSDRKNRKLYKLISHYKYYLIIGMMFVAICLAASLVIYSYIDQYKITENKTAWNEFADFLMTLAQIILGAGLIGGGIGGVINFIIEEMKGEEEKAKERLKGLQGAKEKRKVFLWEMQKKLKVAYDNVELARVLIKSHYNQYFLQHYNHCNKILKTEESEINHRISITKFFKANLEELRRIDEKKNSDLPITNRDDLARIIMEIELNFDFETSKMKTAESIKA